MTVTGKTKLNDFAKLNDSWNVQLVGMFQLTGHARDCFVFTGGTDLRSTLDVAGNIAAASALTVTGNTTLNDFADLNDSLNVKMDATFQSTVHAGDSLVVTGGTELNSTLDVAGNIAAASALTFTGNTRSEEHTSELKVQ